MSVSVSLFSSHAACTQLPFSGWSLHLMSQGNPLSSDGVVAWSAHAESLPPTGACEGELSMYSGDSYDGTGSPGAFGSLSTDDEQRHDGLGQHDFASQPPPLDALRGLFDYRSDAADRAQVVGCGDAPSVPSVVSLPERQPTGVEERWQQLEAVHASDIATGLVPQRRTQCQGKLSADLDKWYRRRSIVTDQSILRARAYFNRARNDR